MSGDNGNDYLQIIWCRSSVLAGGGGDDQLKVAIASSTFHTDGDLQVSISASLDGGDGNDQLMVQSTAYVEMTLALQGGAGNDSLAVSDYYAGDTGISGQA